METKAARIWEVDFLRGIAIILMTTFHIIFDLGDIYGLPIDYRRGIIFLIGRSSAILFMLIAGISCSFSKSNVKRGVKVFIIAMIITLVTHLYDANLGIKFGILHFFGISMMISPLFIRLNKYWLIFLGTLAIIIGSLMSGVIVESQVLFPIGLISSSFSSADYYPLFPWLGVFLYGVALSKILYSEKRSIFKFSLKDNVISFAGKHSLLIYVIHQPMILLILSLIMMKR
jgi:uncharacterized membrane protein